MDLGKLKTEEIRRGGNEFGIEVEVTEVQMEPQGPSRNLKNIAIEHIEKINTIVESGVLKIVSNFPKSPEKCFALGLPKTLNLFWL